MDQLATITNVIKNNVKLMVDNPERVIVECEQIHDGATLHIIVDKADVGKIIGKHGRSARALRVLANAMGNAAKIHIGLDITE